MTNFTPVCVNTEGPRIEPANLLGTLSINTISGNTIRICDKLVFLTNIQVLFGYRRQWNTQTLTVSQTSCPAGSQPQTSPSFPSVCGQWDSGSPRRWAQPRWGSYPSSSSAWARQNSQSHKLGKKSINLKKWVFNDLAVITIHWNSLS